MKRFFLFIFSLMLTTACFAANRLQVVINYKNGIYNGRTYSKMIVEEEDFIKDKPRYEGRFFDSLYDYVDVAYAPDTINPNEPVVYVEILQVTNKGNIVAEVTQGDRTGTLKAKGGTFGTFLNLFGDGMQSLGKALGAWL